METKGFFTGIKEALSCESGNDLSDDFVMDCSSMLVDSDLKAPWITENLMDFCGLSEKEARCFLAGLKGGYEVGRFEGEAG
jgi:hypothetical protein